jgi:hypothetical protein
VAQVAIPYSARSPQRVAAVVEAAQPANPLLMVVLVVVEQVVLHKPAAQVTRRL